MGICSSKNAAVKPSKSSGKLEDFSGSDKANQTRVLDSGDPEESEPEKLPVQDSLGHASLRLDSHHAAQKKLKRVIKKVIVYLRLYLNAKRSVYLREHPIEKLPFYGPERHKAARSKLVKHARHLCVYLRLYLNSKKNVRSRAINVIFLRHGESTWNAENRFTGWTDVPLSSKGESEAIEAGQLLKLKDIKVDLVFTSALNRSIKTCELLALPSEIPVFHEWRLNERHYGSLQGLNKAETTAKHGEEQVKIWRRSFDIPPPLLDDIDVNHPRNDPKYIVEMKIDPSELPLGGESLKDCVSRVLPLWTNTIGSQISNGKQVLIVAHGNSLRALVKHLENISDEDIAELNIPTGIPLVFSLDRKSLLPIKKSFYLGDEAAAKAKADAVAAQAVSK
jgi:2,3-bisphosphoglycerate-dependent phosphoglycerate mutase